MERYGSVTHRNCFGRLAITRMTAQQKWSRRTSKVERRRVAALQRKSMASRRPYRKESRIPRLFEPHGSVFALILGLSAYH
jgi:hypothetical protein